MLVRHKLSVNPHGCAARRALVSISHKPLRRGDLQREVGRAEQVTDPRLAARSAVRHLERRRDAVRGHEAERPRRLVVAAAGDDDRAEPVERGAGSCPSRRTAAADGRRGRPVGVERARVARRPLAPPRRGPRRCARRGASGRASDRGPGCRGRSGGRAGAARSRCRRPRPGTPRARAGARARARRSPTVIGFSRSRGECVVPPRHADHDRVERLVERPPTDARSPRSRASACATEGGPAKRRPWSARAAGPAAGGAGSRRAATRAGAAASASRWRAPVLVRIAAETAGQPGRVEDERRADQGHAAASARSSATPAASPARRRSRAGSRHSPHAAAPGRRRRATRPGRRGGRFRRR